MASTIQIVPKYQHPHVETYIYDNTTYEDIPSTEVDDSVKHIAVFRSDKGIDNKFVKMTAQDKFVDTFGKTNYAKYGQPLMMPLAELATEVASVNCLRCMPDDATRSNSVVLMYYRTAERVVGEETQPVFQVMFRKTEFTPDIDPATNRFVEDGNKGVITNADIETAIKGIVAPIAAKDEGGAQWNCLPLMYLSSVGRGDYGNKLKWRVTTNAEYEKDYEQTMYSFEVLSTENGTTKIATYVGGLVTAQMSQASTFINDVINEYTEGSYPLYLHVFEENVQNIYTKYVAFLEGIAETGKEVLIPDDNEFNLLFGTYVNSVEPYEYMQVVSVDDDIYPVADDADGLVLDETLGTSLKGGYDGKFSVFVDPDTGASIDGAKVLLTEKEVNAAIDSGITAVKLGESTQEELVYVKVFSGAIDKLILASRRIPADVLFDANYPYYAKVALVNLALARNDAMVFIDCGTDYTSFSQAVMQKLTNKYMDIFSNRLVSKNVQWYDTREPFSFKKVRVTSTYWLAQHVSIHFKEEGRHVPLANARAVLSDYIKNSMQPSIELYETELKEELNNNRFNYWEAVDENRFLRSTQNTAQENNSDLLEESNMHVLMWLKRNIENDCTENLYNFANATERASFSQVERAKYEGLVGTELFSFNISFDMNEWEAERSILHCYLEIQFRTINKRTIIEIDVNKRDFTA